MTEITIERRHGYLFDSNGNICLVFGNWSTGTHRVPEYVDARRSPDYVDGAGAHDKSLHDDYIEDDSK